MPNKSKDTDYQTLAITAVPIKIKSRLKLAAFASNRTPGQVVIDLLDKHLPQYEDIIAESTENT